MLQYQKLPFLTPSHFTSKMPPYEFSNSIPGFCIMSGLLDNYGIEYPK